MVGVGQCEGLVEQVPCEFKRLKLVSEKSKKGLEDWTDRTHRLSGKTADMLGNETRNLQERIAVADQRIAEKKGCWNLRRKMFAPLCVGFRSSPCRSRSAGREEETCVN